MNPILKRRLDTGLSQETFAATLGVSVSSVRRWERGKGIRQEHLMLLAEHGVDVAELLSTPTSVGEPTAPVESP